MLLVPKIELFSASDAGVLHLPNSSHVPPTVGSDENGAVISERGAVGGHDDPNRRIRSLLEVATGATYKTSVVVVVPRPKYHPPPPSDRRIFADTSIPVADSAFPSIAVSGLTVSLRVYERIRKYSKAGRSASVAASQRQSSVDSTSSYNTVRSKFMGGGGGYGISADGRSGSSTSLAAMRKAASVSGHNAAGGGRKVKERMILMDEVSHLVWDDMRFLVPGSYETTFSLDVPARFPPSYISGKPVGREVIHVLVATMIVEGREKPVVAERQIIARVIGERVPRGLGPFPDTITTISTNDIAFSVKFPPQILIQDATFSAAIILRATHQQIHLKSVATTVIEKHTFRSSVYGEDFERSICPTVTTTTFTSGSSSPANLATSRTDPNLQSYFSNPHPIDFTFPLPPDTTPATEIPSIVTVSHSLRVSVRYVADPSNPSAPSFESTADVPLTIHWKPSTAFNLDALLASVHQAQQDNPAPLKGKGKHRRPPTSILPYIIERETAPRAAPLPLVAPPKPVAPPNQPQMLSPSITIDSPARPGSRSSIRAAGSIRGQGGSQVWATPGGGQRSVTPVIGEEDDDGAVSFRARGFVTGAATLTAPASVDGRVTPVMAPEGVVVDVKGKGRAVDTPPPSPGVAMRAVVDAVVEARGRKEPEEIVAPVTPPREEGSVVAEVEAPAKGFKRLSNLMTLSVEVPEIVNAFEDAPADVGVDAAKGASAPKPDVVQVEPQQQAATKEPELEVKQDIKEVKSTTAEKLSLTLETPWIIGPDFGSQLLMSFAAREKAINRRASAGEVEAVKEEKVKSPKSPKSPQSPEAMKRAAKAEVEKMFEEVEQSVGVHNVARAEEVMTETNGVVTVEVNEKVEDEQGKADVEVKEMVVTAANKATDDGPRAYDSVKDNFLSLKFDRNSFAISEDSDDEDTGILRELSRAIEGPATQRMNTAPAQVAAKKPILKSPVDDSARKPLTDSAGSTSASTHARPLQPRNPPKSVLESARTRLAANPNRSSAQPTIARTISELPIAKHASMPVHMGMASEPFYPSSSPAPGHHFQPQSPSPSVLSSPAYPSGYVPPSLTQHVPIAYPSFAPVQSFPQTPVSAPPAGDRPATIDPNDPKFQEAYAYYYNLFQQQRHAMWATPVTPPPSNQYSLPYHHPQQHPYPHQQHVVVAPPYGEPDSPSSYGSGSAGTPPPVGVAMAHLPAPPTLGYAGYLQQQPGQADWKRSSPAGLTLPGPPSKQPPVGLGKGDGRRDFVAEGGSGR
ncbi:hypothetical protein HK101_000368 [Irineochytrium annulatum]|nr:hypothetical protein HK101_000368 [Irineochytrium annulatum]